MVEYTRQPCPIRVVEDCGCAFLMGSIGCSLFQYMRGFRNAPSGLRRSLTGGVDAVKIKAPQMAGNFAIWGTTFSCVDCTMTYLRQREDTWNSIASGAATGGILAARNGIKAMGNGALVGGMVLALIEGAGAAVATIYAAPTGDGTSAAADAPQHQQWEQIVTSPESAKESGNSTSDALAEIERVVDKCNAIKQARTIANLSRKRSHLDDFNNTGSQNFGTHPPTLMELVKLANILKS